MSQPKIVSIDLPSRRKPTIPPILHSVRQQAKHQLNELIQSLFNNTDDALFELADRSRSDADQHLFFESMRQIRLQRKQISSGFIAEFYKNFERAFEAGVDEVDTEEADEVTVDNISLVHNDDLEVSVAIAGIISKVTSQFSLPIMQLTKRIDHLCHCQTITERLNPLGPERLSAAFVDSIECLEIDIKVRIILLKLYERFVMERLGRIYDESNNMLIDAGVLPDLKQVFKKNRSQQPSTPASVATASSNENLAADRETVDNSASGFGVIQSLLAATRGETTSMEDGVPNMSTAQLLSALSAAQIKVHDGPINIGKTPTVLDLRQLVVAQTAQTAVQDQTKIRQADDDVVNFVGMLFDYILNDRNLAIPMKALISRLQIPIVKIAILDKSFFEKGSHPARQLLNELSSAGIGWSSALELKRDAMYNKVESIVMRVLSGSAQDKKLFAELLTELRAWVNTDHRRRNRVEQRVKESERGRAKTTAAKETVQKLINQKASGMRLPPAVGRFISDTWSKVLVYLCVKGGVESTEWQHSVQVLDNLLWCLQPLANLDDLLKRDKIIPELITQLHSGMDKISLADATRVEQIECLEFQLREISQHDRQYLEED
ncbi:MAG: DUF1631 domain-containing protein, partial [Gammaproteobacteria bacterium]|nr:DUF1631 domain-containing protein [Gammaproteobacteria bacterium]